MGEHDLTFQAMGSHVRLLVGEPGPGMVPAATAAKGARRFVEDFDATLSRFRPDSELSRLNADERERVPASELLRRAVEAGIFAAERSGGLVDPTLVDEIEGAGYVSSRAGIAGLPLSEALAGAPPRRPAQPRPDGRWARQRNGTSRAASLHDTQAEAEEAARAQAKRMKTELVIKGRDGQIQRRDSYGGDPARRPG